MTSQKKKIILACSIFVALELVLAYLILFAKTDYTDCFCILVTSSAFVFSLFFAKSKTAKLVQFALFSTVMSDVFLIIADPMKQSIAMTTFSLAQIAYFIKLLFESKSKKLNKWNVISRVVSIIVVLAVTIAVLKDKTDYLSLISMFYFTNLIINLIFSFIEIKSNVLFSIGLLLFVLCDIITGLQCAIGVYLDISTTSLIYKIVFADFNLAWLFYIPSQTLIALSSTKK